MRKTRNHLRRLTPEEFAGLLHAARFSRRDTAILRTLDGSGVRVGELVRLRVCDVTFPANGESVGKLRVEWQKSKKSDERECFIDGPALDAIRAYLFDGRGPHDAYEVLFVSRKGGRLTERAVQHLVAKYAREAGIVGRVSPHAFRRTFSTTWFENGGDLVSLQMQLGHSDESTTRDYVFASAGSPRIRCEFERVRSLSPA